MDSRMEAHTIAFLMQTREKVRRIIRRTFLHLYYKPTSNEGSLKESIRVCFMAFIDSFLDSLVVLRIAKRPGLRGFGILQAFT